MVLALASGFASATTYRLTDLGTLGGSSSIGFAVNASGQVTGYSSIADDAEFHAFLWNGATMLDLGTLGGESSQGAAINASGQVTGQASTAIEGEGHAFLWDGNALQDLNDLIDPADPLKPFVTLFESFDINDRGQIVAEGFDSRRSGLESDAYLVSPNPVTAPDPGVQIRALLEFVLSLDIKAGVGNALAHKLQNALAALDRPQQNNRSALGILNAFTHSVEAQRGKALTAEQADHLVSTARDVIDAL
jgi:probable HAF family extracellular repeat protein